ncbi:MAG: hypothetical protein WC593_00480 [Methanoregula sp.]
MIDEPTGTGTQWMKAQVLAGITGGILLTIVLHLANGGWHGLMEYNSRLFGIYADSYLILVLLGFLFTGALSVFFLAEHGITRKKVMASGILSGIIAGMVFSNFYLYTDILLNPTNYPPFPGDFFKMWTFFNIISSGWFILVGISMLTGMIVATMDALASGFLEQRFGKTTGYGEDDVKDGNVNQTVLFALFTLIIAILIIPPVIVAIGIEQGAIAQEPFGPVSFGSVGLPALPDQPIGDDHASNVTRWMQEHAGQEVSAGEYLVITNPGYLDSRPQNVRAAYSRMKVRVPNFSNPDPGDYDRSAGGMQYGKRSVAIAAFGYRGIPDDQQPAYPLNYTSQCILNESMIEVSNGLADREIPAVTYFETVCPDFFFSLTESQKAALNNQSMNVSKIPGRDETAAYVPSLYVSDTHIELNMESLNVVVFGIFGLTIVAAGYLILRRKRK